MTGAHDAAGVLDTSTLILIDRLDAADLPGEPVITAVTLAELSVGPLVATGDPERAARQARLQQTEAAFEPLPFDAAAARAFDAMIAATALAADLPLYTCNAKEAPVDPCQK